MSSDAPLLHDDAVRRRAATDFTTNLVVEAGAGTGKTSLLVERVLNAVGLGIAPVESIAAITFTEKAAGEMRTRLATGFDRLRKLAAGEVAPAEGEADRAFEWLVSAADRSATEIARRALEAMEHLDRATVTTIHGFCAELLRGHPVEAGVDPDFRVDEGQHAERVRDEEWERFTAAELGPGARRADSWRSVLARVSLPEIEILARELADFHIPGPLLRPPFAPPDARELFGARTGELIERIGALLEAQTGLSPMPLHYFTGMKRALEALHDGGVPAFRASAEGERDLVQRFCGKNHPKTPNAGFRGVPADEFVELARASRKLARALYEADDALMRSLVELLAPFVDAFRESYLRQGFVGFSGLLDLSRNLLREHREVRRRLKERFRLLFVDEFQDTDPLQYEIVLFLAEALDAEAGDAFEVRLESGKLFVVGDAKQSVYRFRGADFTAYRRAVERIAAQHGERLDLVTNFRSVPGVLAPVNALFEHRESAWKESDAQPCYIPIAPAREQPDREPRVELWSIDLPPGANAEERREAEGRAVAAEVERLVRDGECDYERITILFRAFTNISHYLRPLRERGIPFVVDGGREFLKRPEVAQMMATLRALAQPADAAALLAFLRSPAGAVSDLDLARFAAAGGRWDWRGEVDVASFPAIARAYGVLHDLSRETGELPADAVVRRVVERTQALALGAAAFEGAQRVANLKKLAAAAGELARDGRLSLEEVVEALAEGRRAEIETDRPLADDAARAVRITSIHRMKGLENDRIFLPDLAREEWRGRTDTKPVAVAHPGGGRGVLALAAGQYRSTTHVWLDLENEKHKESEEVRVLYVALTRARERLVVIAGPTRGNSPWIHALAPWGYDAGAPPADGGMLGDGAVLHRRPPAERGGEAREAVREEDVSAAVADYGETLERLRAAARPPVEAPSGLGEDEESARASDVAARAASRDLAQAAGVVLHRLLEAAGTKRPDELRRAVAPLADETAAERGLDAAALLRESREILAGFLRSPLARRLAETKALGRELPLLLQCEDGRVFHGSIDLLYETALGEIVVADFKTDRDEDAEALRERYREQLAVYAEAVRRACGLAAAPRAELWLLRSGRRVEI